MTVKGQTRRPPSRVESSHQRLSPSRSLLQTQHSFVNGTEKEKRRASERRDPSESNTEQARASEQGSRWRWTNGGGRRETRLLSWRGQVRKGSEEGLVWSRWK